MTALEKHKNNIQKFENFFVIDPNNDLNPEIRKVLELYTELGSSIVLGIIILLLAIIDSWKVLLIFIPIYLFQLVIIEYVKAKFKRTRPQSKTQTSLFGFKLTAGSFPSGHASNIFTIAFLISNYYQLSLAGIIFIYMIAASVSASRLFLGKHYLVDVIAGALAGIFLAALGSYLWINILNLIIN